MESMQVIDRRGIEARSSALTELLFDLEAILDRMEEKEEGPIVLHAPCEPGEVTSRLSGTHVHRCACGEKWKHKDSLSYGAATREEFNIAHSCPACGADVREKYYGEGQ